MGYKDESDLRELYVEKDHSVREVADKFGVHHGTISRWLKKHGITVDSQKEAASKYRRVERATYTHDGGGYPSWVQWNPDNEKLESVKVHRLLAVSLYGVDAVSGSEVHHKNGVCWDNRPENIKLMDKSEHTSHHRPWEDSPVIP